MRVSLSNRSMERESITNGLSKREWAALAGVAAALVALAFVVSFRITSGDPRQTVPVAQWTPEHPMLSEALGALSKLELASGAKEQAEATRELVDLTRRKVGRHRCSLEIVPFATDNSIPDWRRSILRKELEVVRWMLVAVRLDGMTLKAVRLSPSSVETTALFLEYDRRPREM